MHKPLTINHLLTIKKEDKMSRLFVPMRIIADVVFTVLGVIELNKHVQAYKKQKQTITPKDDD